MYLRCVESHRTYVGVDHPATARSLLSLAHFYALHGLATSAQPLFERALEICEHVYGGTHAETGTVLYHLAACLHAQEKYAQANAMSQSAFEILRDSEGEEGSMTVHAKKLMLDSQERSKLSGKSIDC
jgi:tetratricopeptide (TPR) repeat protein